MVCRTGDFLDSESGLLACLWLLTMMCYNEQEDFGHNQSRSYCFQKVEVIEAVIEQVGLKP